MNADEDAKKRRHKKPPRMFKLPPRRVAKVDPRSTAGEDEERIEAEDDFGVPIPGLPLPREQWTHVARFTFSAPGFVDWRHVFGREAPLVFDLGCGNGRFTIASALRRPTHDHVALDALPLVIRYATKRTNQRGLRNVRMLVADAHDFLATRVAPESADEIHLYHPQPYRDDRRDRAHERLVTPAFLELIRSRLKPEGTFFAQTDNEAYWRYIRRTADAFFEIVDQPGPWIDDPRGRTRREIYARKEGLTVRRATGTPRAGKSPEEWAVVVASLPAPSFDAGR